MPRVKLYIATSLDGHIAREDGSVDWLFTDGDYGYEAFYDSIDAVLMGRKTYDQVLTFGPYPYAEKESFVLSRSRTGSDANARFLSGSPGEVLDQVARVTRGDVWLVGGAGLLRDFVAADLVDEYRVALHPIVLGRGIPLFLPQDRTIALRLENVTSHPSGLVQLDYVREPRRSGR